jgi:hypothetical protein
MRGQCRVLFLRREVKRGGLGVARSDIGGAIRCGIAPPSEHLRQPILAPETVTVVPPLSQSSRLIARFQTGLVLVIEPFTT